MYTQRDTIAQEFLPETIFFTSEKILKNKIDDFVYFNLFEIKTDESRGFCSDLRKKLNCEKGISERNASIRYLISRTVILLLEPHFKEVYTIFSKDLLKSYLEFSKNLIHLIDLKHKIVFPQFKFYAPNIISKEENTVKSKLKAICNDIQKQEALLAEKFGKSFKKNTNSAIKELQIFAKHLQGQIIEDITIITRG